MHINHEYKGTILIKDETKSRLKKSGFKGQTYDQIINELLDLKLKSKQLNFVEDEKR